MSDFRFRLLSTAAARGGLWLVLAIAAAATGCGGDEGPPRVAVSGVVSLDGQPLPSGQIRFIPTGETKGPAAAGTIENGAYQLPQSEGPILGTHRVEIEATGFEGFAIDDETAFAENVERKKGGMPKNPVPEIYNRRSTLTATVSEDGSRTFDFPLSSHGGQTTSR
jgi:hypothetical protein